ncbi:M12 family metallopeptidase [Aureimonas ureilytica]|uniref:M12 family metallopeptidase n=1 Tax=Aureimonas ureilytica TaxID=401562 RepID=UPI000369A01F|nr:M12 family metallopeptidase [Aureimonas ureilytica]
MCQMNRRCLLGLGALSLAASSTGRVKAQDAGAAGTAAAPQTAEPQAAEVEDPEAEFLCSTIEGVDRVGDISGFSAATPEENALLDRARDEYKFTPFGVALFGNRWRKHDGLTPNTGVLTLGVHFLNGSSNQRQFFRSTVVDWTTGSLKDKVKFRFDVPVHLSQIRVSFGPGGNWSYVGRQNLGINALEKTMNIETLNKRVCLHECGHALGLGHEHRHPNAPIVWDEDAVIADMAAQGWSPAKTKVNILDRLTQNYACAGDPTFNPRSVMLYPIPLRWTKNGFSSGQNSELSDGDRRCVEGLYL